MIFKGLLRDKKQKPHNYAVLVVFGGDDGS